MEFRAKDIAKILGGAIEGNPEVCVNTVAKIEEGTEGALSFLANPKYTPYLYQTDASIVIVSNTFKAEQKIKATLIRVENPYAAFAQIMQAYNQAKQKKQEYQKMPPLLKAQKLARMPLLAILFRLAKTP
jgi:UDP-3-O-[3-hydroxymyristoyl] glucosamine N-acyltransferase